MSLQEAGNIEEEEEEREREREREREKKKAEFSTAREAGKSCDLLKTYAMELLIGLDSQYKRASFPPRGELHFCVLGTPLQGYLIRISPPSRLCSALATR